MPCTTILVGKLASNDGSTMIARNDDGRFDTKKLVMVEPNKQPRKYKSKISHVVVELPDNPVRYSATPNVDLKNGQWAANGINSYNVGMTATETITSNPRVYAADPLVKYQPASRGKKEVPGGIGEEDLVVLVLPYIKSAREGVLRLGSLLEQYGTYENNGVAFNDKDEIWWLESIGGHHWIARRVKDDHYVMMPNQFGLDQFDFDDAYGEGKENLCSNDLKKFVEENHLLLKEEKTFNPRFAFGSNDDSDHIYNNPRAWYIGRYFNGKSYKWEGENADFNPESDNIPWSLIPDKKITLEDIKHILSSHFQGTEYNPYSKADNPKKGIYRPIGVANTDVMAILQIRNDVPYEIAAVEWLCFGCNVFNTITPFYTNTSKVPDYYLKATSTFDSNNFYWASRLLAVLSDHSYGSNILFVERYQKGVMNEARRLVKEYDSKMIESKDFSLIDKANDEIAKMVKKETDKLMLTLLDNDANHIKVRFYRGDN